MEGREKECERERGRQYFFPAVDFLSLKDNVTIVSLNQNSGTVFTVTTDPLWGMPSIMSFHQEQSWTLPVTRCVASVRSVVDWPSPSPFSHSSPSSSENSSAGVWLTTSGLSGHVGDPRECVPFWAAVTSPHVGTS